MKQWVVLGLGVIFILGSGVSRAAAAQVSISAPNGGECLEGGASYTVRWTSSGVDHVALGYKNDGTIAAPYTTSSAPYFFHDTDALNTGTYAWTVPTETITTAKLTIDGHDATHASVDTDASDAVFSIDSSTPTKPDVSLVSKTASQIKIAWSQSTDAGCADLSGYRIYRNGSAQALATVGPAVTSYTDTTVSPGQTYTYKVEAYDGFAATGSVLLSVASDSSSVISPTPLVSATTSSEDSLAPQVTNLRARSITQTGATIFLDTNELTTATVTFGPTTTYGQTVASKDKKKSHSLVLTGLTPNTTYHYRVQVTDSAGNTLKGDDHQFTTLATGETPQAGVIEPKVTRLYLNQQPITVNQEATLPLDVTADSVFRIEGRGAPKTKITVRLYSDVQTFETEVGADGLWSLVVSLAKLEDGEHRLTLLAQGQKSSEEKQVLKFTAFPHSRSHDVLVLTPAMLRAQTQPRRVLVFFLFGLALVVPGLIHVLRGVQRPHYHHVS